MTAIITAIYDDYEALQPVLPQSIPVDWVCVTDNEALANGLSETIGWRGVYQPREGVHPNRAAKRPKMLPWEYTDDERSIWVDASFRVISPTFAEDLAGYPLAQWHHPQRYCIYDEADVSETMTRYADEPIRAQVEHYRALGHPEHWGLWATGVIAHHHTKDVREFGRRWHEEIIRWSYQDQLSEAFVLRETHLRPVSLPGTHTGNAWLAHELSARHHTG